MRSDRIRHGLPGTSRLISLTGSNSRENEKREFKSRLRSDFEFDTDSFFKQINGKNNDQNGSKAHAGSKSERNHLKTNENRKISGNFSRLFQTKKLPNPLSAISEHRLKLT